MSDNKCETKECISCDVTNCIHHTMENTCSAGKIQVGPGAASDYKDTCCDTFRSK